MRLIKVLVVLILAALIGLVGYAYFGDMSPVQREVRSPLATTQGGGTVDMTTPDEGADEGTAGE